MGDEENYILDCDGDIQRFNTLPGVTKEAIKLAKEGHTVTTYKAVTIYKPTIQVREL